MKTEKTKAPTFAETVQEGRKVMRAYLCASDLPGHVSRELEAKVKADFKEFFGIYPTNNDEVYAVHRGLESLASALLLPSVLTQESAQNNSKLGDAAMIEFQRSFG